jgi:hypothetical protein
MRVLYVHWDGMLPSMVSAHCYTERRANRMAKSSRIFYRIWQIYQKPVEELVDLLGIEIPPVPQVSLAGITAESILLYWKPTDFQSVSLRYVIQVNGIKGECLGSSCLRIVRKVTEPFPPFISRRFRSGRYINPGDRSKASALLQYPCHRD